MSAVNAAGLCGHNDWRMPTELELQSIADFGRVNAPNIDPDWFPNSRTDAYWSAQSYVLNPSVARVFSGDAAQDRALSKSTPLPVRLVRGAGLAPAGSCAPNHPRLAPDSRYADHGDGTVTDLRTGLMWKRCVQGRSGADCATGTEDIHTQWSGALQAAYAHHFAGYEDWRLPNINELASLPDPGCLEPSINTTRFPNTPETLHWTSTAVAATGLQAWMVRFDDAGIVGDEESNDFGVIRLVRGGTALERFDAGAPVFRSGFE